MSDQVNDAVLKHMEFIQIAVVRMAANSFVIKGWTVTLVAAILAFTTTEQGSECGWIALIPALVFWGLDAYYLRQERLFRKLYDYVRIDPQQNSDFSLDTTPMEKCVSGWVRVCFSKTIFWFYLPLTTAAGLVANYLSR